MFAYTVFRRLPSQVRFVYKTLRRGIQSHQSTIYALSSGHGKCGVAVIRVSGQHTQNALMALVSAKLPKPREAALRKIKDPDTAEMIDKGLIVWFPGPHSFTGEDCCELHIHGGSAVITATLSALDRLVGLRHAEPGEFTKRAFFNGKLDLTEVDGLADLIHAETEAQRKQALRQMDGALSKLYSAWRKRILKCAANVEAYIDFSEDDNIEEGVLHDVEQEVHRLQDEIQSHLNDNRRGERLRDGFQVAIIGRPNVGKSSLLNAICQRPAAIVSPMAGTTRDVVETALNIGGYPILLSDTAGLRQAEDTVEREGVRRAMLRAEQADLKVVVLEAEEVFEQQAKGDSFSLTEYIQQHLENLGLGMESSDLEAIEKEERKQSLDEVLVVLNKTDLLGQNKQDSFDAFNGPDGVCAISCTTGSGIDSFLELLKGKVSNMCGSPLSGNPSLTQARYRTHLEGCLEALHSYDLYRNADIVLAAAELRTALRQIGKITGKITSEEILDVVFRDFCIGK